MIASWNGHHDIVRTLLQSGADVNSKSNVRNQMIILMMITFIVLTIMMMMMIVVINDEDGDDCR